MPSNNTKLLRQTPSLNVHVLYCLKRCFQTPSGVGWYHYNNFAYQNERKQNKEAVLVHYNYF